MVAIYGIRAVFKLKGDKAKVPEMHLCAGVANAVTASGTKCWALLSDKYIRTSVANVDDDLACKKHKFMTKFHTPFVSGYHPAKDTSRELDSEGTRYYQELIGVLQWAIELGRVDMLLDVNFYLLNLLFLEQAIYSRYTILWFFEILTTSYIVLIQTTKVSRKIGFIRLIGWVL